jgi:acyl-CoA synthetase (AMP-forming)/AMP-acid ligase II
VLYPSPLYSPTAVVDALLDPAAPDERCAALHGVPTHHLGVLQELARRRGAAGAGTGGNGGKVGGGEEGLRALRTGIAAGSPVPMELMRRLGRELGLDGLTNAYGMSACSTTVSADGREGLI